MKKSKVFPSKYLKASDLNGDRKTVTIAEVRFEEVGEDEKAVVYFEEIEKGLPLNLTNWDAVEEITGSDDSDEWGGTEIALFHTRVDFKGKRVDAIRIETPTKSKPKKKTAGAEKANDDDIPF